MLIYGNNDDLHIIRYVDSDFTSSPNDMKSTSDYVLDGGGVIAWKRAIQTLCLPPCRHSFWSIERPLWLCFETMVVFFQSCMFLTSFKSHKNYYVNASVMFSSRNKDKIGEGLTVITHTSIKAMVADPLTKCLLLSCLGSMWSVWCVEPFWCSWL